MSNWRVLGPLGLVVIACVETEPERGSTESGTTDGAPAVVTYAATAEACCGEDPHPVHGVEARDGGFVLVGKTADDGGGTDGFVVKLGPDLPTGNVFLDEDQPRDVTWSHRYGKADSTDTALSVAALDAGVFVAGVSSEEGAPAAALRKLNADTGSLIWSAVFPSSGGKESAAECIHERADGGVLIGGLVSGEAGALEGFKSYGNPISGIAAVWMLDADELESGSAPSPTAIRYDDFVSVRALRPLADGGFVFLAPRGEEVYVVVRADAEGEEIWRTELPDHGEATDLAVLTEGGEEVGIAVVGHAGYAGGIEGSVTRLDLDGAILWGVLHGNPEGGVGEFAGLGPGAPELIYDECWGVQPTEDGGLIVACGTGIEGCDGLGGTGLGAECRADPRTTWRSYVVGMDGEGSELWHRTDSYRFEEESDEAAASAAEHVLQMENGGFAAVIDQDFGIGLIVLEAME